MLKKVRRFYNKKRPRKDWSAVFKFRATSGIIGARMFALFAFESVKLVIINLTGFHRFLLFPRLKKVFVFFLFFVFLRERERENTRTEILLAALYTKYKPNEDNLTAFHDWLKCYKNVFR